MATSAWGIRRRLFQAVDRRTLPVREDEANHPADRVSRSNIADWRRAYESLIAESPRETSVRCCQREWAGGRKGCSNASLSFAPRHPPCGLSSVPCGHSQESLRTLLQASRQSRHQYHLRFAFNRGLRLDQLVQGLVQQRPNSLTMLRTVCVDSISIPMICRKFEISIEVS